MPFKCNTLWWWWWRWWLIQAGCLISKNSCVFFRCNIRNKSTPYNWEWIRNLWSFSYHLLQVCRLYLRSEVFYLLSYLKWESSSQKGEPSIVYLNSGFISMLDLFLLTLEPVWLLLLFQIWSFKQKIYLLACCQVTKTKIISFLKLLLASFYEFIAHLCISCGENASVIPFFKI